MKIIWGLIIIALIGLSCTYFNFEGDGNCVYCTELNSHYITGPVCDPSDQALRAFIDSVQAQGSRLGQNWVCEIR